MIRLALELRLPFMVREPHHERLFLYPFALSKGFRQDTKRMSKFTAANRQ